MYAWLSPAERPRGITNPSPQGLQMEIASSRIAHYLFGFFTFFICIFCFCIFLRRLANLVAGFLGVLRWFFDMIGLQANSTGRGANSVEWWFQSNSTRRLH
jgi:hypothetical protein